MKVWTHTEVSCNSPEMASACVPPVRLFQQGCSGLASPWWQTACPACRCRSVEPNRMMLSSAQLSLNDPYNTLYTHTYTHTFHFHSATLTLCIGHSVDNYFKATDGALIWMFDHSIDCCGENPSDQVFLFRAKGSEWPTPQLWSLPWSKVMWWEYLLPSIPDIHVFGLRDGNQSTLLTTGKTNKNTAQQNIYFYALYQMGFGLLRSIFVT